MHSFNPVSKSETVALHELMVKSIAYSGATAFRFLNNPFFKEYQNRLCGYRKYSLPQRDILFSSTLPIVLARYTFQKDLELKSQEDLTILLDGWKDSSGNSVYAVLLIVTFFLIVNLFFLMIFLEIKW